MSSSLAYTGNQMFPHSHACAPEYRPSKGAYALPENSYAYVLDGSKYPNPPA
jgi:hypothetical protein